MSQDSGTGQPNRYATVDNRSSRHTTTGGRVNSFAYKEGGSSVAVLRCLVTKEMQRVGVQYSGSRFSSSVPRVSAHDGCPICVYRQGLYRDAHSPPVTDTVHATKQRCRVSERHYISRVLQSPLPRDSSLHDGKCGKHSAISLKTPGSLPSNLLIPIFPYPSTEITENVFDFRLRNHTPIPGTAVWPFSSTLGIHQDYDSDQYAGTRDEHQCLSVRGRLAHLFTISRPVPPRHCTGAQSLPHDGPPHSRQEVGTDPKTEIPFSGIPVRPGFLPGHSNSGSISQNQALISSFLLSQGGCAHMWQILLGLCVHKTNGSSGTAAHLRSPTLHLSTLGFQCFNQHLWIPVSPMAEEDFQWWKSAHNVLGAAVTQTEPDTQLFTDASNIGWGAHWNALTVSGVWTTTEKTLHINVLELEAIHRAMLHWLRKLMGLIVLVASDNSTVVSYINKQGGTRSIQLCRRTKKLLVVCQANQIVIRARHISGRFNVLADIL